MEITPKQIITTRKITRKELLYYVNNLDKLLGQSLDWFFKRCEAILHGNWNEADSIDFKYLRPLDRKIKSLLDQYERSYSQE